MRQAWSLLRPQPWYRADVFARGLARAGYELRGDAPRGAPGRILVIWNRYGSSHQSASEFERQGGTVLVAENGYLGAGGTAPKFDVHPGGPKPHHYYALAVGWHNGRGSSPCGPEDRFSRLGVELKPWRTDGGHILVAPNRSFGVGKQVMPEDWARQVVERLRGQTKREVRVRPHPGNDAPQRPLAADLEGCWAAMVWSSGAAVHSLLAGIPTFIAAPFHILKGAGAGGSLDEPVMPDRLPHFERMAYAQWRLDEIESGLPFRALLP